ncbi:hypothetical protein SK128_006734 [Halocaridina rubra]|uniref:Uncharacterized protein n=1 Tax=Halocaridina rubra TaxID=373956 RepID=A0AAN8X5S1_HALRR
MGLSPIPLVILPAKQQAWQRLYMTATHSSAAHSRSVPFSYDRGHHIQDIPEDSLDWNLQSQYDHQNDLFVDKSTELRRPGLVASS